MGKRFVQIERVAFFIVLIQMQPKILEDFVSL